MSKDQIAESSTGVLVSMFMYMYDVWAEMIGQVHPRVWWHCGGCDVHLATHTGETPSIIGSTTHTHTPEYNFPVTLAKIKKCYIIGTIMLM